MKIAIQYANLLIFRMRYCASGTIIKTIPGINGATRLTSNRTITRELIFTTLVRKYRGVKIDKALNGKAGLELFKVHEHDIVITDINMPGITGVQMAAMIHSIKPDTKFIVITGDVGNATNDSAEGAPHIDCYIGKPVFFKDLFDAIVKCVAGIGRPIGTTAGSGPG